MLKLYRRLRLISTSPNTHVFCVRMLLKYSIIGRTRITRPINGLQLLKKLTRHYVVLKNIMKATGRDSMLSGIGREGSHMNVGNEHPSG